jgi:HPt (histidine-containing phosphotransfer) domain-containing protein
MNSLYFSSTNLEELAGDDKEFLQDLWDSYEKEFTNSYQSLFIALQNQTPDSVLFSHNIKSGSSSLGALEMVEISRSVEENCKIGNWDAAKALYPRLEEGFRRISQIFADWMKTL